MLREDGALVAPTELKRWSSTLDLLEDWPAARPSCATWTWPTRR